MKKTRHGVCTRYLATLPPGSTLNVVHRTDGRFLSNSQKKLSKIASHGEDNEEKSMMPKLLIGAGTGIAPLRALIHADQEHALASGQPTPPTTLFFGCRNRAQDFFFADEWAHKLDRNATQPQHQHQHADSISAQSPPSEAEAEVVAVAAEQPFTLIPSFSRDQPQKIYLQHRLLEHAAYVYDLLVHRHATVVVCGSSGAMPKAVRAALLDVLVSRGTNAVAQQEKKEEEEEKEEERIGAEGKEEVSWTHDQAERYLAEMDRSSRYLQETW